MATAALVTGGGGYVGGKLCTALHERGYAVTAVDVHFLDKTEGDGLNKVEGDIRDQEFIFSVLEHSRADVVFHVASYGMSGRDMLNKNMIEQVNVQGTKNVIEACVRTGTSRLVYTSTYNVVFGGQEIRDGGPSLPYLTPEQHVDHYSRTKCIAEQEVRGSNGRSLVGRGGEEGETLKTCALRCAGIYGKGEQRHLPRIVSYIEAGLFSVTYGSSDSLVEFLHADNFCQAHIKAAEAMEKPESPVVGNSYFISDGEPINNFLFFKPLVEGLGYNYPSHNIPMWVVYYTAFLIELVHSVVGRYIYNFQPLLTRAEVLKTGVTHYFSMKEALQDFGYRPEHRSLDEVVAWFKERGHGKPCGGRGQATLLWRVVLRIMLVTSVCMLIMWCLPLVS